jgi:hypothetical protein
MFVPVIVLFVCYDRKRRIFCNSTIAKAPSLRSSSHGLFCFNASRLGLATQQREQGSGEVADEAFFASFGEAHGSRGFGEMSHLRGLKSETFWDM